MSTAAPNRPGGWWLTEIQAMATESILAAVFLYGMDAFAHLRLTVPGFLGLTAGWIASRGIAGELRRRASPDWTSVLAELGGPALWLAGVSPQLKQPWTAPQIAYAVMAVFAAWRVWRWLLRASVVPATGEAWRWLVAVVAGAAAAHPFITDLQVGGADGRWYTGVYIDFVQQLRSGVFPVFIGQGEFSYNGSANLFRSAPMCLWLGGIWDWLTWQALPPVAIRNLSIVTAAVGATVSMYAALIRLPAGKAVFAGARWTALGVALLYGLGPGALVPLYYYELQMTFTALIALPWVFYGNYRLIDEEGGGEKALAGGLAVAWMAHPPLAIIATFCTAALQCGRIAFVPLNRTQVMALAKGALLFVLLTAYYFLGMSELSSLTTPQLKSDVLVLLAVLLAVLGGVQAFYHRRWFWLVALAVAAGLTAWQNSPWLGWIVAWAGLFGLVTGVLRWRNLSPDAARMVLVGAVTMLLAAAAAQPWAVARGYPVNEPMARALSALGEARGEFFRPLVMGKFGSCQPGYGLWLLAAGLLAAVAWLRSVALALLASLVAFFVVIILRVPGVSDFLVHYAPPEFGIMVAFPLPYRIMAPLAALIGVGGYAALLRLPAGRRRLGEAAAAVLLLAAAWGALEAGKIVATGKTLQKSRAETARIFSPDNYALGRYAYLMLYPPLHYMDGKQMPWMESRLLTPHFDMLAGPEQLARQFEAIHEEVHALTSRQDKDYPEWRWFTPDLEVQPGETLLLRFEFDPGLNPLGWLILESRNGYQEHYLDPAFGGAGFGAGPIASRVLAVTNSGIHTEHFKMKMKTEAANTLPLDGGRWGTLHVSRYDADRAPLKLEALIPYRARVVMPESGYLESPRQWLPGYRGRVDGRPVEPIRTKGGMLGLPVPAGTHSVELRFVGSARLWIGLVISVGTALGLLAGAVAGSAEGRESIRRAWRRWIGENRA